MVSPFCSGVKQAGVANGRIPFMIGERITKIHYRFILLFYYERKKEYKSFRPMPPEKSLTCTLRHLARSETAGGSWVDVEVKKN